MTNDLAALSEATTPGTWEATERSGYHEILAPDDQCDWYGRPKCHAILYGDTEIEESGANAAFIVALVNAYRSGDLVLIEREGMRERAALCIWHQLGQNETDVRADQLTKAEVAVLADAAIAAILGGEHE